MAIGPPRAGLPQLFPDEMLAFPKRLSACAHRIPTKADYASGERRFRLDCTDGQLAKHPNVRRSTCDSCELTRDERERGRAGAEGSVIDLFLF
jgi:hypothetical protein